MSGQCRVSVVNEEISDEKLKPHFQCKATSNGQGTEYCAWRIWYLNNDTFNLQPETHVLPQPLALATSGCEHLPCLCLPLFSGTVYLGNFYIVLSARTVTFIIEPVSNTRKKSGKNKAQGIILLESNSAIFDICGIPNVEANDGVIFIRALEFNVIWTKFVSRKARNLAAGYSGQELFRF